jgi:hypothetical protein
MGYSTARVLDPAGLGHEPAGAIDQYSQERLLSGPRLSSSGYVS